MIPLSAPTMAGNEWDYVKSCIDTGWVSSAGKFVGEFEEKLADYVGSRHAVATVNGSAALHITLQCLGVRPNDLVIIPNLTFVASANSVKYAGADPIFIDVDHETWQMDLDLLERYLTTKCEFRDGDCVRIVDGRIVRAVMPVHTLGDMGNIQALTEIARKFELTVVEDSTEALGSSFNDRSAGTFGRAGTFSFNGNKIISTGGGGMVVTDDTELAEKIRHLSTQAKTSPAEYYHDEVGYNYRLVNVLAAIGVAQLEQLPEFLKSKKRNATLYRKTLSEIGDIEFPKRLKEVSANCWLTTFRTIKKDQVLESLSAAQIEARPFWVPMSKLPMYKDCEYVTVNDVAQSLYEGCVSVPSSADLAATQVEQICDVVRGCF